MSGVTDASSMFESRHLPPNYAFKPTDVDIIRVNPSLPFGGVLTQR